MNESNGGPVLTEYELYDAAQNTDPAVQKLKRPKKAKKVENDKFDDSFAGTADVFQE